MQRSTFFTCRDASSVSLDSRIRAFTWQLSDRTGLDELFFSSNIFVNFKHSESRNDTFTAFTDLIALLHRCFMSFGTSKPLNHRKSSKKDYSFQQRTAWPLCGAAIVASKLARPEDDKCNVGERRHTRAKNKDLPLEIQNRLWFLKGAFWKRG